MNQLNNPEYRWYHKDEMSKIMPYVSERKRLGIKILDYEKLRRDNDELINEHRNLNLDWNKFKSLVIDIKKYIDPSDKKKNLDPRDRLHFEKRDKGICYICGSTFHYGSCNIYAYQEKTYKVSHLHHIVPTGDCSDGNIVTLCTHCHQMVHQALFIAGEWKFGRPI